MTRLVKMLRKIACLLVDHAPVVVRRGDDSILTCERCHKSIVVFVKGLYAVKDQKLDGVSNAK